MSSQNTVTNRMLQLSWGYRWNKMAIFQLGVKYQKRCLKCFFSNMLKYFTMGWNSSCKIILIWLLTLVWKAYWVPALQSSMTLQNSGCKCPMVGSAMAFKILSGTLEGPGPNKVFSGIVRAPLRLSGGVTIKDMLRYCWINKEVLLSLDGQY